MSRLLTLVKLLSRTNGLPGVLLSLSPSLSTSLPSPSLSAPGVDALDPPPNAAPAYFGIRAAAADDDDDVEEVIVLEGDRVEFLFLRFSTVTDDEAVEAVDAVLERRTCPGRNNASSVSGLGVVARED
jgi:hypothetical protein